MSLLEDVLGQFGGGLSALTGDIELMRAAVSAVAQVMASDGEVHASEVETAIDELETDAILTEEYSTSALRGELSMAIERARTPDGRTENARYLAAIEGRPVEQRNSVFLIAFDVASAHHGVSAVEGSVLDAIAGILAIDKEGLVEIVRARALLLGNPAIEQGV